jgi:hypothetical protein
MLFSCIIYIFPLKERDERIKVLTSRTTTIKRFCSDGGSDFSNKHLVTHFYGGSSVMSPNRPLLLWPKVATVMGDITSSYVATVTIR